MGYSQQPNPAFHLEKHLSPTHCHTTAVFIIFMQKSCSVDPTKTRDLGVDSVSETIKESVPKPVRPANIYKVTISSKAREQEAQIELLWQSWLCQNTEVRSHDTLLSHLWVQPLFFLWFLVSFKSLQSDKTIGQTNIFKRFENCSRIWTIILQRHCLVCSECHLRAKGKERWTAETT